MGTDQPRVRFSSFRGESRQDLIDEIQDSPQCVFPLFSGSKGRKGSLFFSYFSRAKLFPDSLSLTRGQSTGHLFPVTSIARGDFHTRALHATELPPDGTMALEDPPDCFLFAIADFTRDARTTILRRACLCSDLPKVIARVSPMQNPGSRATAMQPTSPAGMKGKGIVCSRRFE